MKNKKNIASVLIQYGKNNGFNLIPRVDFETIIDCDSEKGVCNSYQLIWKNKQLRQPTDQEIDAAEIAFELEEKRTAYFSQRKQAYPSIEEQLDMMWHYIEKTRTDGTDKGLFKTWFDAIKTVKDKYPKTK